MAAKELEPVFTPSGLHVYMRNIESGDLWECPADAMETTLKRGFFELTAAPVDDGVHEDEAAAPKKTAKKAASKDDSA